MMMSQSCQLCSTTWSETLSIALTTTDEYEYCTSTTYSSVELSCVAINGPLETVPPAAPGLRYRDYEGRVAQSRLDL